MAFLEVTSPGHVQGWIVALFFFLSAAGLRVAGRVAALMNASAEETRTFWKILTERKQMAVL